MNRWRCQCDCGRLVSVISQSIVQGRSTRCRSCKYKDHRKLGDRVPSRVWHRVLRSKKLRSISVDITREYLWALYLEQKRKCALSGLSIKFASTVNEDKHGETTASLDRILPSKGYVRNNVRWVHKEINRMKGALFDHEFKAFCFLISGQNIPPRLRYKLENMKPQDYLRKPKERGLHREKPI